MFYLFFSLSVQAQRWFLRLSSHPFSNKKGWRSATLLHNGLTGKAWPGSSHFICATQLRPYRKTSCSWNRALPIPPSLEAFLDACLECSAHQHLHGQAHTFWWHCPSSLASFIPMLLTVTSEWTTDGRILSVSIANVPECLRQLSQEKNQHNLFLQQPPSLFSHQQCHLKKNHNVFWNDPK